MPFKFGDVVLIPFPFTDQTALKKRPAVVVSSEAYNLAKSDLVVMAITSQMRPVDAWHGAGLLKPSAIKPVIATVERRLVIRRLGDSWQWRSDDPQTSPRRNPRLMLRSI